MTRPKREFCKSPCWTGNLDGKCRGHVLESSGGKYSTNVNGGMISEAYRKSLWPALSRKTVSQVRTVKDVDAKLDRIQHKYRHLGDGFAKETF